MSAGSTRVWCNSSEGLRGPFFTFEIQITVRYIMATQDSITARVQSIVNLICVRKTKGWEKDLGTEEERAARIKAAHDEVQKDFETMPRRHFAEKYDIHISHQHKLFLIRHRPEGDDELQQRVEEEERRQDRLERYPPNRKFYSFTNATDSRWNRYDEPPTEEQLQNAKAIRWTAGMMAASTRGLGPFAPTAILHGGLVIEFEYVYTEKGELYSPMY